MNDYITVSSFDSINTYLNFVLHVYLFTVLFATPLYVLYSSSLVVYSFVDPLYITIVVLFISVVYVYFVILYLSTDVLENYRTSVLERFSNSIELTVREVYILFSVGCIYIGMVVYVYISSIGVALLPFLANM